MTTPVRSGSSIWVAADDVERGAEHLGVEPGVDPLAQARQGVGGDVERPLDALAACRSAHGAGLDAAGQSVPHDLVDGDVTGRRDAVEIEAASPPVGPGTGLGHRSQRTERAPDGLPDPVRIVGVDGGVERKRAQTRLGDPDGEFGRTIGGLGASVWP